MMGPSYPLSGSTWGGSPSSHLVMSPVVASKDICHERRHSHSECAYARECVQGVSVLRLAGKVGGRVRE